MTLFINRILIILSFKDGLITFGSVYACMYVCSVCICIAVNFSPPYKYYVQVTLPCLFVKPDPTPTFGLGKL